MIRVGVRVELDLTSQVAAEVAARAEEVRRRTARDIQRDWAAGVRVASGALRDSIADEGHPDHIAEDTAGTTTVGTQREYAGFENYGTRAMSGSFALEKAVEKNKSAFDEAMRGVVG